MESKELRSREVTSRRVESGASARAELSASAAVEFLDSSPSDAVYADLICIAQTENDFFGFPKGKVAKVYR